eukprot:CAMPEP_0114110014 /NCGR_PEP_ID=MMETSP0043_2-20121206/1085_1 /TAXON_ID=464988 /ORGANISM="Hemiselmis andersenii, Strain CCMP644" /LENGTH=81 /DNA_ID=CAMNT_0001201933 /DNA_START=435 /DNA_END=680 /DNA_ORIENTATION=+
MSWWSLSALEQYITTSDRARTFSRRRRRAFSLADTACMPSVSTTIAREMGSNAAHAPAVHESCRSEVSKMGSPLKNVWFIV